MVMTLRGMAGAACGSEASLDGHHVQNGQGLPSRRALPSLAGAGRADQHRPLLDTVPDEVLFLIPIFQLGRGRALRFEDPEDSGDGCAGGSLKNRIGLADGEEMRSPHLLPLIAAASVSSCATVAPKLALPAPVVVNDVRVEVTGVLKHYGLGGIGGFRGAATNQSSEPLSYCVITLELLDPSGAKIGDAMATTTHLDAGQTWRFDAHNANTISSPVDRVRVADVRTDRSLIAGLKKQRSALGAAKVQSSDGATRTPQVKSSAASPADAQADRVERAILRVGETRPVAGAATEPFKFTIQLAQPKDDGTFSANFQEVAMVHTVVGNLQDGVVLYRVGLVAGEPRIVLRGKLYSRRYEVVWETWPDNQRRAGSPVSTSIEFDH